MGSCTFSQGVWNRIAQQFNCQILQGISSHTSVSDWWDDVSQWSQPEPARHLQIIIYTAWNLWKERCRRIFDNRALTQDQLVTVITSDIANYYIAAHATVGASLPYNFLI